MLPPIPQALAKRKREPTSQTEKEQQQLITQRLSCHPTAFKPLRHVTIAPHDQSSQHGGFAASYRGGREESPSSGMSTISQENWAVITQDQWVLKTIQWVQIPATLSATPSRALLRGVRNDSRAASSRDLHRLPTRMENRIRAITDISLLVAGKTISHKHLTDN
jgi:hypothetical protein